MPIVKKNSPSGTRLICITLRISARAEILLQAIQSGQTANDSSCQKISVLQLFISRMPKMCAILQLVSAPLNPMGGFHVTS